MEKCRYIVLTDINPGFFPRTERDDIQSLIRLLLYSNEIDIEGIVLCSSCFLRHGGGKCAVSIVERVLDAYEAVKPNLDAHAPGYSSAEDLRRRVHLGIPAYGRADGARHDPMHRVRDISHSFARNRREKSPAQPLSAHPTGSS